MEKELFELVLHPVRMRIVLALSGEQLSAQQMAQRLPDVPQATLYRHIHRLADGGVIRVAEERAVRGTIEKIYMLDNQAALQPEDLSQFSKEDHMRYFIAFTATLIDDFGRYLRSSEKVDLLADGVGYRKIALHLSDEEFAALAQKMNAPVLEHLNNSPSPERRRRLLSSIVIPAADDSVRK